MPFVRNVYLVVSGESQIPVWLDRSKVNVVLHEDIIPERLLPTFNSTTIEMYLCRIPGLAEHFVYSNDDMLAVNSLDAADFFDERGRPVYQLIRRAEKARRTFRMQCQNSYELAARLAGASVKKDEYFYIAHSMDPMLKSVCEEVHSKAGGEILKRCTKFREPWNFTQYLFPDYAVMTGGAALGKMPLAYFTTNNANIGEKLEKVDSGIICINDDSDEDSFQRSSPAIQNALTSKYAGKSRFEL